MKRSGSKDFTNQLGVREQAQKYLDGLSSPSVPDHSHGLHWYRRGGEGGTHPPRWFTLAWNASGALGPALRRHQRLSSPATYMGPSPRLLPEPNGRTHLEGGSHVSSLLCPFRARAAHCRSPGITVVVLSRLTKWAYPQLRALTGAARERPATSPLTQSPPYAPSQKAPH